MGDGQPRGQPPSPREKFWAIVRILLGLAQMGGAVLSFYLLLETGMNDVTFIAVAATCLCTTVSILLFGRRKSAGPEAPAKQEPPAKRRKKRPR